MSDAHRQSGTYAVQDPPSGRFDPPGRPSRQTDIELAAKALEGKVAMLEGRVARIESDARDHKSYVLAVQEQLSKLHRDNGVFEIALKNIESSLKRIEDQRDVGGQRARNTVQLVLMLLAIVASIAVGVVSIVTR